MISRGSNDAHRGYGQTSLNVVRVLVKFAPGATGNKAESIKRSVTSRHDGSKIPEFQQSFLAEKATCIVERL